MSLDSGIRLGRFCGQADFVNPSAQKSHGRHKVPAMSIARSDGQNGYQPPPCCWGARAAAGPTTRSNSACGPTGPWIGACVTTSSFSRLMLLYSTIELLLTGGFCPAGGGPPMSALTSSFCFGGYAIVMLSL